MSKTKDGENILKNKEEKENAKETEAEVIQQPGTEKKTVEAKKEKAKEEAKKEKEVVTNTKWEMREIDSVDTLVKTETIMSGNVTILRSYIADKTKPSQNKLTCEPEWIKIKETRNGKVVFGGDNVDLGKKCSYCEERNTKVQNTTKKVEGEEGRKEHVIVTDIVKKNGSELVTVAEDGKVIEETLNGESTAQDCAECGTVDQKIVDEAEKMKSNLFGLGSDFFKGVVEMKHNQENGGNIPELDGILGGLDNYQSSGSSSRWSSKWSSKQGSSGSSSWHSAGGRGQGEGEGSPHHGQQDSCMAQCTAQCGTAAGAGAGAGAGGQYGGGGITLGSGPGKQTKERGRQHSDRRIQGDGRKKWWET